MFKRLIGILTFCCSVLFLSSGFCQEWQELNSQHFRVFFSKDKDFLKFAKEVLDKAEKYYSQIAQDLGYPRYSEFWTWEKRVKIYLYSDHNSYLKATGQPEWTKGVADYKNKQIISYVWNEGFLDSLLPHEMAHLIFRDFVGFKGEIPLWLDEGVAQWSESEKRKEYKRIIKRLFEQDLLISLEDMMKLDIRTVKTTDRIYIRSIRMRDGKQGTLLVSGNVLVDTYYLQSVSLVGFLIERFGSDNFAHFCRQLRDGKGLEEALKSVYPTYLRSIQELEDRWRDYLEKL
ncbi:MAG: hypothetical protein NC912_00795 [Candidatus Omnitrophica bacterium]|nr:hypothetical protein [Candidatus Omnitrophota bacterium]